MRERAAGFAARVAAPSARQERRGGRDWHPRLWTSLIKYETPKKAEKRPGSLYLARMQLLRPNRTKSAELTERSNQTKPELVRGHE